MRLARLHHTEGTAPAMDVIKCLSCGRPLRAEQSRRDRRGRRCKARVMAAAKNAPCDDYNATQLDNAREALEEGAILPTSRPNLWTAVSSDGSTTYLVALQACTCPAGLRQRRCYHRLAVAILTAARPARAAA
ncbi:hypothetical protein [Planotetraspora sp. GP83]|uniref:hypothetical protein n=1 Tax=Planotetraspora sp. GP83 TaxID=3156264 RepID=UPI003518E1C2